MPYAKENAGSVTSASLNESDAQAERGPNAEAERHVSATNTAYPANERAGEESDGALGEHRGRLWFAEKFSRFGPRFDRGR